MNWPTLKGHLLRYIVVDVPLRGAPSSSRLESGSFRVVQKLSRRLGFALLAGLLVQCTFSSQSRQIHEADKAIAKHEPKKALDYLEKATHGEDTALALQAARQGARLAQLDLKSFQQAIDFYRFIVIASDISDERRQAEKNIAQIYFENLLYYDKAVIEYEKLLQLDFSPADKFQFRFNVAKSELQLGNLNQASAELDMLSKQKNSDNDEYDLEVFKANLLIAQKKQQDAANLLESVIKRFPDRAKKENLALTLTVCYEELEEFEKAIASLIAMKQAGYAHPEFIDARIQRLQTRLTNRPLANGFKK